MTEIPFTPDQLTALQFPGNVIVSAGAGSGKTKVLVEKYIHLLLDHPEWAVESVVAITFTRKAAAELKLRIVETVLKMIEAKHPDIQRLKDIRNAVGAAPIGTIHNFCGRVLREFAYDAHVDPDFAILEGAEEVAAKIKAVRAAVASAADGRDPDTYQALLQLMTLYSASQVENMLIGMLGKRQTYSRAASRYTAQNLRTLFTELKDFHASQVAPRRQHYKAQWLAVLTELRDRTLPGVVKDLATQIIDTWKNTDAENWSAYEALIQSAIDGLLTKALTCRKREFTKAGIEDFDAVRDRLEQLAKAYSRETLRDLNSIDQYELQRGRQVSLLFLKAADEYAQLRGGQDDADVQLLDYEDMEMLAARLLTNKEAMHKIRKRYPFLILDEFQDTSQAQWEILSPLVTDEKGSLVKDSLFIVGDKKQGVYGFRDAQVNLFSALQRQVAESNEDWLGSRGAVSMRANFRTHSVPLEFINKTFERLLHDPGNTYAVDFEPLDARVTEGCGRVEFLLAGESVSDDAPDLVDTDVELTDDAEVITEAELVAAHANRLIKSGEFKAGDIALLFRKRSAFTEYEEALRNYNIPVVSQQSSNLFHQPELAEVMAALEVILYPHRDVTFVHYLRCASIGFPDDLLLKIGRSPGKSFYDKARNVARMGQYQLDDTWRPISDQEAARFAFALGLLATARSMVAHRDPYYIVKYVIDELCIYHTVAASYRGKQAQANLDKMLLQARAAGSLPFEDFLDYLDSEKQSSAGLGEAIDLSITDAVKIMTVHSAKGLEFPVVYLPNTNSSAAGFPDTVTGDGADWISVRMPSGLSEGNSFLMDHFARIATEQQKAEERRIFYVAMTRCRNVLVLSGNPDKQARGETFYQWIEDEFTQAERDGLLKRVCDYPELQSATPATFAQREQPDKRKRSEKIASAIQLARQIPHKATVAASHPKAPISTPLSVYLEAIVPDFILAVLAAGNAAALSRYCQDQSAFPLDATQWVDYCAFLTGLTVRLEASKAASVRIQPGPLYLAGCSPMGLPQPVLNAAGVFVWISCSTATDDWLEQQTQAYQERENSGGNDIAVEVWTCAHLISLGNPS